MKTQFGAGFNISHELIEDRDKDELEKMIEHNQLVALANLGRKVQETKGADIWEVFEVEDKYNPRKGDRDYMLNLFVFTRAELVAYRDKVKEAVLKGEL